MSKLTEYKNNYIAANYDRINLTVPKGMKAEIEKRATSEGKSTNGFIGDLIRAALEGVPTSAPAAKVESTKAAPAKEKNPAASKKDMDIFLF